MNNKEISHGKRIKEVRTSKKLSQQQVADYVGLSRATINSIEGDNQRPSVDFLMMFADLTNTSLDSILSRKVKIANEGVANLMDQVVGGESKDLEGVKAYIKSLEAENQALNEKYDQLKNRYEELLDKIKNMQKSLTKIFDKGI